jgi:predicted kinase
LPASNFDVALRERFLRLSLAYDFSCATVVLFVAQPLCTLREAQSRRHAGRDRAHHTGRSVEFLFETGPADGRRG